MSRRIRSLKPELIEDEKVAPLSDSAFRLFVSMITLADDHGNVRADVRWLQGQVWWAFGEPPNVLPLLAELTKANLIEPYGVRGGTYCHLRGWGKHQRIDNAGKNKVPPPNDPDVLSIDVFKTGDWKLSPKVAEFRGESGTPPTEFAAGYGEDRRGVGRGEEGDSAKPAVRGKTKSRLPDGWGPSRSDANLEAERVAVARGVDIGEQLKNLRDWAVSNNAKKADWDATWRNWTRNAKPSHGARTNQTALDAQFARVEMLRAQERDEGESE